MNRKNRKCLAIVVMMVMVITSFAGIVPASSNVAKAAVDSQGVITEGEGSFKTTLSNGETADLTVTDCKLTVKVGSKSYQFRNGLTIVGMAVTNVPDDLLHIFTLSGKYYCMDLRSGVVIEAYRNAGNGKYCLKTNTSGYEVFGSSIINTSYFYEYVSANSVSRQRLITRGEFDEISGGKDPSDDTVTPTPTATPNNNCGCVNGGTCTCPKGQCKCENCNCGSNSDCKPTPTPTPTATPNNNCGCANGGTCTCPKGQCKCENCNCGSNSDCKPTPTPTVTPSNNCGCVNGGTCTCPKGQCKCEKCNCGSNSDCTATQKPNSGVTGDNVNNADVNASGNGNNITINQTITNTTVNGNGNSVGTGVNTSKPVVSATAKPTFKVTAKPKAKKIKKKTYYCVTRHGNRVKLWKVTQKVTSSGKIKTTRQLKSFCLFNEKKQRMDLNSFKRKKVKKCTYVLKSHRVVVINKNKSADLYPIGKGNKKPKHIKGKFTGIKCNSRGLAYALVTKKGKLKRIPGSK